MKKKILSILSLSLIFALIFAISSSAATPRWSYIGSISPGISTESDLYFATVSCPSNVVKIEVDLELYQKGLLGSYTKKASHSGTINASGGTVYGSYDLNANKTYRVDATVKVTTSSGQSETVTVSSNV